MNKGIAAVDMGTNSFHLIIVQVKSDGSFKIIDREREMIRLGSHSGKQFTLISEGEMEKAIDVLKEFYVLILVEEALNFSSVKREFPNLQRALKLAQLDLAKCFFQIFISLNQELICAGST